MRGRVVFGAVVLGMLVALPACGSDDSPRADPASNTAPATSSTTTTSLPEPTEDAIPEHMAPLIEPYGFEMQSSSISNRPEIGQQQLSLYVRPVKELEADAQAQAFIPLSAAVLPVMLERYPDIEWIDICQMKAGTPNGYGESDSTETETRIELSRAVSAQLDWDNVDLGQLLALSRLDPKSLSIDGSDSVEASPTWTAAVARSQS
jgi:hypothetical protein